MPCRICIGLPPKHALANTIVAVSTSALAQHLQIVIKDTADNAIETTGWLKSENRWTVSQFDTALSLLEQNIGFCWLPLHKVLDLLAMQKLTKIQIEGSAFKQLTGYLICPTPEHKGPGTELLSQLILQHRKIALP